MTALSRRNFLGFAPLLVAAPAIVRASSLMKVKSLTVVQEAWPTNYIYRTSISRTQFRELLMPGLQKIALRYEQIPDAWDALFSEQAA